MTPNLRYGTWKGDAINNGRGYGPLPDKGMDTVALVEHTTETKGMPGYNNGATAPHWTYYARYRTWHQHAYTNRRVGTLRGYATTGIRANEKSVQVEIIAYTDRTKTGATGLWVGDFTDDHYNDLAEHAAWCRGNGFIDNTVYGPAEKESFWYADPGSTFPRMSQADWYRFGGVTAHGGIPGQTHGDTGALNLHRIAHSPQEVDPMAGYYPKQGDIDDREVRLFAVERVQAKLAIAQGGDAARGNRQLIESKGMTLGSYDADTQEAAAAVLGTSGAGIGPTEERWLDARLESEHPHPQYLTEGQLIRLVGADS